MLPFHQQLGQSIIEGSGSGDVLGVLVALEDVHVGTDSVLKRQVHHLAHAYRAWTTNQTYKSGIDSQISDQAQSYLKCGTSSSLLALVSGYFVAIGPERVNCIEQFRKVGAEGYVVTSSDDFAYEFRIDHACKPQLLFQLKERSRSVV